jgi:hypothetical protein
MTKVLLNNVDHGDLSVAPGHHPSFGDAVNLVLLLPSEFAQAAREYPILLRRDAAGALYATALLGLDRDENLFLGEGGWDARYVPAVRRCGPFSIAVTPDPAGGPGEPMVHVDLADPRVGTPGGVPVFLPHGGNAPYLEHVTAALRQIHAGAEQAGPLYAAWEAAGLIEPIRVEVQVSDEREYRLEGFLTVSQAALTALDGAALEQLNRTGALAPAFALTWSTANVAQLIERKNRKDAARA